MLVTNDCIVSMRYMMKNSEGLVLENTLASQPVSYLQGGTSILPLLQQQMEGLKPGDRKNVFLDLLPGETSEAFIFDIIIDDVRNALPEEILLGYPVQTPVRPCEEDCDCYRSF